MIKLGFLLPNTGGDQLSYHVVKNCNAACETGCVDPIIFFENSSKPWLIPTFAMMNISEAYSFDGVAIATTFDTASRLCRFPGPKDRYYYLWDMEWVGNAAHSFEERLRIYCNPKLKILARSEEHASIFQASWGRQVDGVIGDVDITKLLERIKNAH